MAIEGVSDQVSVGTDWEGLGGCLAVGYWEYVGGNSTVLWKERPTSPPLHSVPWKPGWIPSALQGYPSHQDLLLKPTDVSSCLGTALIQAT